MAGGEYEPKDSRHVTGEKGPKDKSWREIEKQTQSNRGEYEPRDSRNVTGTASTPDGRWTNTEGVPPRADGRRTPPADANNRPKARNEK